ncbi:hypothetical protein [Nitratireductor luteus]|uniref:hypothetical protein n=1 Tax=Nitratireductor luteus TaxID=2976980 RepID=UPI00223F9569|nr:hypothetical protein [Nitratireductor luteus]
MTAGTVLAALSWSPAAQAQPAPSFEAECGTLREKLAQLQPGDEELVVIDVVGPLTMVEHDGTLGYMAVCEAPDPQVLCITYRINDYEVGDRVILSGGLNVIDEGHIRLDPCLHYPPEPQ